VRAFFFFFSSAERSYSYEGITPFSTDPLPSFFPSRAPRATKQIEEHCIGAPHASDPLATLFRAGLQAREKLLFSPFFPFFNALNRRRGGNRTAIRLALSCPGAVHGVS